MITRIQLFNFKRHQSLDIEFGPGLNVIRGPNAAGKSTIIKAILYAKFGAQAAGAKNRIAHNGGGKVRVVLHERLPDGRMARVERTATTAKVFIGDSEDPVASGNSVVTEFFEEQYGMEFKLFRMLATSPQGEAAALLTLGAAALQRQVEEMAKVNVIDDVLGLLSADVTRDDARLTVLPIVDVASVTANLAQAHTHHGAWYAEHARLVAAKKEVDEALAADRALQQAVAGLDQKTATLVGRAQEVARVMQQTGDRLAKLQAEELGTFPADLDELRAEEVTVVNQWAAITNAATERVKRIESITADLAKAKADLPKLQADVEASQAAYKEIETVTAKVEAANAVLQEAQTQASIASERTKELRAVMTDSAKVCPTCHRPLKEMTAQEREQAVARVRESETVTDAAVARMQEAGVAARDAAAELKAARGRVVPGAEQLLAALNSRVAEMSSALAGLNTPLEGLPDDLQGASLEVVANDAMAKYQFHRAQFDALTARVEARKQVLQQEAMLKQHLAAAVADAEAIKTSLEQVRAEAAKLGATEGLAARIADNQAASKAAEQPIAKANEQMSAWGSRVAVLQNDLKVGQAAAQERADIEARLALAKELQSYLRQNRGRLVSEVWDGVLAYASSLISGITEGRLQDLCREDGEFSVLESEVRTPAEDLSGAQRAIVGTCLRLAITQSFYGHMGSLLFDEISADMDDGNAASTAGMLSTLPSQIIMVTHRQGDAVQAGNVIELEDA